MTRRSLRGLCAAAVVLLPAVAGAQDAPADGGRTCWRGRPAPRCDSYWVTELGYYHQLASTRYREQPPDDVSDARPQFEDHASVQLGRMTNRGAPGSAFGGVVQLGVGSTGVRAGVQGRYRQWLGDVAGLELSLGPQVARIYGPYPRYRSYATGLSGDVSLDMGNLVAVTARGDVLYGSGQTAAAAYGGVRLGAQASVAGAVVTAIGFALLFAALSGTDF